MVTSRSRQRWVFPKGRIEVRQSASEAALTEAWEEAGLLGAVIGSAVGTYHYEKYHRDHHVTVFIMKVVDERQHWPEAGERDRQWVSVAEAIRRVDEPGLKAILRLVFQDQLAEEITPTVVPTQQN
jgi:8-oxo-dGTP pyrophosphatase MutT (NUDIX family)